MSTFWKVRIATFVWGFLVIWFFTGQLNFTSQIFLTQVIGNTILMKLLIKNKSEKIEI